MIECHNRKVINLPNEIIKVVTRQDILYSCTSMRCDAIIKYSHIVCLARRKKLYDVFAKIFNQAPQKQVITDIWFASLRVKNCSSLMLLRQCEHKMIVGGPHYD